MLAKSFAVAAFALVLGLSSQARAEPPRLASLRGQLEELDQRAKSVRTRAERAHPTLRQESERIVGVVDGQRTFLSTKLDIFQLRGSEAVSDATLKEMESRYVAAERLLGVVEGWYTAR